MDSPNRGPRKRALSLPPPPANAMTLADAARRGGHWRAPKDHRALVARGPIHLGLSEALRLAAHLPLLFHGAGRAKGVVALLSLTGQDRSPFLDEGGRLPATMMPRRIALAPFVALPTAQGWTLGIDPEGGALGDEGHALLDHAGQPTPEMREIGARIGTQMTDEARAAKATAALARAGCFAPVKAGDTPLPGLWNINTKALAALSDDAIAPLFRSGALALAQAHLISVAHLARFGGALAQAPSTEVESSGFLDALALSMESEA